MHNNRSSNFGIFIMMKVGFTGTRHSDLVSQERLDRLKELMWECSKDAEFHHGDCIGMDAIAHSFARSIGYFIVVHPPINPRYRAFCHGDIILPPLPYIARNHRIVQDMNMPLFAVPINPDHIEVRSGTWKTIRYAYKFGKEVVLI